MSDLANESQHTPAEPIQVGSVQAEPEAVQRVAAPLESAIAAAVGTGFSAPPESPRVQRMAAGVSQSSDSSMIRREPNEVIQRKGGGGSNETGIPDSLKSQMESLAGFSLDHVRVHYNSPKPAELGTDAYSEGDVIYLGPGQERHLRHELGHVVQQAQGRVQPTTSVGGMAVNDDASLESEADTMGAHAS